VARSLAQGKGQARDTGDGLDQLAELGGTVAAAIAKIRDEAAPEVRSDRIELWEENVPVVEWFLLGTTQWRRSMVTGLPTGLDYTGMREAARMKRLKVTPEMFDGLQAMELAYIEECARTQPAPPPAPPPSPRQRRR
jgi:hypothetical protein